MRTPAAESQATVSVGMAIALGALSMTFAAVLLAYAVVRVQAPAWPPPGEAAPPSVWPWPLAATLFALSGSVTMSMARRKAVTPAPRLLRPLLLTAGAGIAFVVIQISAWVWLVRSGLRPSTGLVTSVVYALTAFHALHALAAVIALLPAIVRAWRNKVVRPASLGAVGSLWHLVTIVWVVVFVAVFVA
ncbi:MAG: cytochrome c oxidase subunit 3 [Deltaproteobacteria bacterium]|nr:cytochrome c oxidase subunit 3 [Deltaproteobacteria bacterium]